MLPLYLYDDTPYIIKHYQIFEKAGIGFYDFQKEIEVILQVLKNNYNKNQPYWFDLNKTDGCNIPIVENLKIEVRYDFNGTYGEYETSEKVNYNSETDKLTDALIIFHLSDSEKVEFNESKYRETIAHELVHLKDDYNIQKKFGKTLYEFTISHEINKDLVDEKFQSNNPIAILMYHVFLDTEMNALGDEIYAELWSMSINNPKLEKSAILKTSAYKEYQQVYQNYIQKIKNDPEFGANKAIIYFTKWSDRFQNAKADTESFLDNLNKIPEDEIEKNYDYYNDLFLKKTQMPQQILNWFKKWFEQQCEKRLNKIYHQMIKSAGQFFIDYKDNNRKFSMEDIKKIADKIQIQENKEHLFDVEIHYENETTIMRVNYNDAFLNVMMML